MRPLFAAMLLSLLASPSFAQGEGVWEAVQWKQDLGFLVEAPFDDPALSVSYTEEQGSIIDSKAGYSNFGQLALAATASGPGQGYENIRFGFTHENYDRGKGPRGIDCDGPDLVPPSKLWGKPRTEKVGRGKAFEWGERSPCQDNAGYCRGGASVKITYMIPVSPNDCIFVYLMGGISEYKKLVPYYERIKSSIRPKRR